MRGERHRQARRAEIEQKWPRAPTAPAPKDVFFQGETLTHKQKQHRGLYYFISLNL